MDADGEEEAVKVFVRIRPLNKRELAENQTIGWDFSDTSMLEDTANGQRVYAYDKCFGPTSTNQETYDIVGKPAVLKAMEGYNGTVFTYGQTGSGKTWTMRGCESDPGMMILCIRDILEFVRKHEEKMVITLKVSYLEVYNEEINDLLGEVGSAASKNLKIVSEDAARGAVIGGLIEEPASSPEDFMAILQRGEASRSYASTEMNNESSRSHTIYRVSIDSRERLPSGAPSVASRVSYLNLVDLAGSERQKSTKAEGKTLKEGANINKSLLALGAVINKLGDSGKKKGKQAFIPYRDSKLTRILKQSLGGNTMTSVLCAVTPAPMHREETVSTLKFGQLCKMIKNSVKTNDGALDDKQLIRQYRTTINELQAQLKELQKIVAQSPEMLAAAATAAAERKTSEGGTGTTGTATSTGGSATVDSEELIRLNEKLVEQQGIMAAMEQRLEEYRDLEESKAAFEEYEHNSRQELDEDIAKLEEEKSQLQSERYKLLKDRTAIDEKESRIGLLITHLDEKESKLRQMLRTMTDQEEQWQRSVNDLKKREDLVDDWQSNHQQQEKRLKESENMQQRKFAELNLRESEIVENEAKLKASQRELQEREQRLQVALSRVANSEQAMSALEDKLKDFEATLKKRENGADVRERDLQSRRKEMESWDVLLREKDKKISDSQHKLDEREAFVSTNEERIKQRETDLDRRAQELRQGEVTLEEEKEKYKNLLNEVESRDRITQQQMIESNELRTELDSRQVELTAWQEKLVLLQERMKVVEQREAELKERVEQHEKTEFEFFNVKVAQITSRHSKELKELQDMVQKQLKVVADFQKELTEARSEISQRDAQIDELEATLDQQNAMIDSMKDQFSIQSDEEDGLSIYSTESAVAFAVAEKERLAQHSDDDDHSGYPGVAVTPNTNRHNSFVPFSGRASPMPSTTVAGVAADQSVNNQPQVNRQQQQIVGIGSSLGLSPGQEFLLQLAVTRKALMKILEQHNALPNNGKGTRTESRKNPYQSLDLSHIDDNGEYIEDHPNTKRLFLDPSMQQSTPFQVSSLRASHEQRRLSTASLPSELEPSPAPPMNDKGDQQATPRLAMLQSIKGVRNASAPMPRDRRMSAVSLPDSSTSRVEDFAGKNHFEMLVGQDEELKEIASSPNNHRKPSLAIGAIGEVTTGTSNLVVDAIASGSSMAEEKLDFHENGGIASANRGGNFDMKTGRGKTPHHLTKNEGLVKQRSYVNEPPAAVRWGHHHISAVTNRASSASASQGHQFSRANRNLLSPPSSAAMITPIVRRTNHSIKGKQKSPPWMAGGIVSKNWSPSSPNSPGGASFTDSSILANIRSPPLPQNVASPPPPPLIQTGAKRNGVPVTTVNLIALSNTEVKKAVQQCDIAELMHTQTTLADSNRRELSGNSEQWSSQSESSDSSRPPSPPPFNSSNFSSGRSYADTEYNNSSFNNSSRRTLGEGIHISSPGEVGFRQHSSRIKQTQPSHRSNASQQQYERSLNASRSNHQHSNYQ